MDSGVYLILAQQFTSHVSTSPARKAETKIVGGPVLETIPNTQAYSQSSSSSAGTLSKLKSRYVQWGQCNCPVEFQETYRPYKTDYTEKQCLICGNLSDRRYD